MHTRTSVREPLQTSHPHPQNPTAKAKAKAKVKPLSLPQFSRISPPPSLFHFET